MPLSMRHLICFVKMFEVSEGEIPPVRKELTKIESYVMLCSIYAA